LCKPKNCEKEVVKKSGRRHDSMKLFVDYLKECWEAYVELANKGLNYRPL
jgi:hypothetical protein